MPPPTVATCPASSDGETLRPSFPDIAEDERPYTLVSHGLPFDQTCAKHVHGFLNAQRVYIIASKSLASQTDCVERLENALGDRHIGTWFGIPAHTPYDALLPIMDDMRGKGVDCLVILGGGSVTDGAKAMAYLLANDCKTSEEITAFARPFMNLKANMARVFAGIGHAPSIPLVFMPTTLSGAEYSRWAGCTNPVDHMKIQLSHPLMFARLLILDPELCKSTPDRVWRQSGVRAIDHCVENICSTNARPESDVACQRGLKRLVKSLHAYSHDPDDLAARLESHLGTNDAMTGLTLRVYCGASHGIGHNLGPLGVGHGDTSCILLPAVLKYNRHKNGPQQEVIKNILWSDEEIADILSVNGCTKDSSDAGDCLRAIFNSLGMPRSLTQVGVGRDKWDGLARNSLEDLFCKTNPVPLENPEQVKEILEMVSGDGEEDACGQ